MQPKPVLQRRSRGSASWRLPLTAGVFGIVSLTAVSSATAQSPDTNTAPVSTASDPTVPETTESGNDAIPPTTSPGESVDSTVPATAPGDIAANTTAKDLTAAGAASAAAAAAQAAPPGRATPEYYDRAIDFTKDLPTPTNVSGAFAGHVAFTQTTYVTPSGNQAQFRPNLIPDRAALMWFFPSDANQTAISAKIGRKTYQLVPPELQPHHDGTYGTEPIVFTKRAWSVVVDADDMVPGISITFTNAQNKTGTIGADQFTFGPPLELNAIGISIGMLTPDAPDVPLLTEGPNAQLSLDYYNRVPVTKYRLITYEPVVLDRIVLRNGSVLTPENPTGTVVDESEKTWMRQQIAKALIGSGISYANLGIPVARGGTEREPRPFRQTTLLFAQGKYVRDNGTTVIRKHGLAGGNGQVTLIKDRVNEFSHEFGHDHGLPHVGPKQQAKTLNKMTFNGGWGYDITRDRMIGNVRWTVPTPGGPLPWEFNRDAMGSGGPFGVVSKYTLHTPYSAQRIQRNLGRQSGWLDMKSPTGYSGWNQKTQSVVPFAAGNKTLPKPVEVGSPTTTIVGFYDPLDRVESWIAPALHANWGVNYYPLHINRKSGYSNNCTLTVSGKGPDRVFNLADYQLNKNEDLVRMNQFAVNVPTRFKPTKATVKCFKKTLVSLDLKPPTGTLPNVVEIGGTAGLNAVTQVPAQTPAASTTLAGFEHNLSNIYGPVRPFVPGTAASQFGLYSYDGSYYQATKSTTSAPPGDGWKFIASSSQVSNRVVELGQRSDEYQDEEDGYAFVIDADGVEVLQSNVQYMPRGKDQFAAGPAPYGTVTVRGTDTQGNTVPIVLRVQANGNQTPAWRFNENDRTYFTSFFKEADNPDLPRGAYRIDFEVQVRGYSTRVVKDAFRVKDTVTVI